MIRHWKLAVAVVGVLTLTGIGVRLAVGFSGSSSPYATAAATATQLTKPRQTQLEQGITAPTVTAEASVVATEARSQFEQQGKPFGATGSRLERRACHDTSVVGRAWPDGRRI